MLSNNVKRSKKTILIDKAKFATASENNLSYQLALSTKSIFLVYESNDDDSKPAVAQLTLLVQEAHDLALLTETLARHR